MEPAVTIRSAEGEALATVAEGRVTLHSEHISVDKVASVVLATVGWSGALKLASHCWVDLTMQVHLFLDLERAPDFVDAYVAARTRHPALAPEKARALVMPYWLLTCSPSGKPDADAEKRIHSWLRPPLLRKRTRLSRNDLIAMGYMGVEYEGANAGAHQLSLFPAQKRV